MPLDGFEGRSRTDAIAESPPPHVGQDRMKRLLSDRMAEVGLAVLIVALMGYLASKQSLFLSPGTVAQIFKYYSPMAMLALGMTFVILTGGIDLSVGFVMMLVMFAIAAPIRDNPGLSPAVALGIGAVAALLTGSIIGGTVAYFRIPAFIASLAAMVAAYGVTLILSQNQSIGNLPELVTWLGNTSFGAESFPLMMPMVVAAYV